MTIENTSSYLSSVGGDVSRVTGAQLAEVVHDWETDRTEDDGGQA